MIMTLRSTRMTLRSTRMSTTGTVRRPYALPGSIAMQRLVSSELKVYTISDTGRLSASLSLGSASTRRSSATSGRCWACRRLGMVAVKGPDGRELAAAAAVSSLPSGICCWCWRPG